MTISPAKSAVDSLVKPLLLAIGDTLTPEQLERLRDINPQLHLKLASDGRSLEISSRTRVFTVPELSPEETARRVSMVERSRERERQIWDSLTPEEKLEHDRQFEELYRWLEESRR